MAYRHYVLLLLLLAYMHCLLTRTLPAFLVSVPVPGCELACAGGDDEPVCLSSQSGGGMLTACKECRARVGAYASGLEDGTWINMRDGTCMQQWQYGILMGYGFALPFLLGSLTVAWAMRRFDRTCLLAASLATWSVATGLMSMASSFWPLMVCRLWLGAAQAFVVPTAFSLLTEYFEAGSQGRAGNILSAGICLGAGVASWAMPLALLVGWRGACRLVGAVGLALAGLVHTTLREPPRQCGEDMESGSSTRAPVVWLLTAAIAVRLAASYVLGAFLPMYYYRAQLSGYSAESYATGNAAIVATGGLLAGLWAGTAADVLGKRRPTAPCLVASVAQVVAAALYVGVFTASSFPMSLACYFAALLVGEGWFGLAMVQVRSAVPPEAQDQTVSLVLSVATIASNGSPAIVGALDPGTARLGSLMLQLILGCLLLTALLLLVAAWRIEATPKGGAERLGLSDALLMEEPPPKRMLSRARTLSDMSATFAVPSHPL